MESIQSLNKKVWYRLVKVFYFSMFIGLLVFWGTKVFNNNPIYQIVNNSATKIVCNYGNRGTYTAIDAGLSFTTNDFGSNLFANNDQRMALQRICGISYQKDIVPNLTRTSNWFIDALADEGLRMDGLTDQQIWDLIPREPNTPNTPNATNPYTKIFSDALDTLDNQGNITKPSNAHGYQFNNGPLFTVQPSIQSERNWWLIIGELLMGLLILILIFEIIRKVFYYIAFGTIRPR